MSGYIFGFDVGTSESKGVIINDEGKVMASAASAHELISPFPGYAEHDPVGEWLFDLKKVFAELLKKTGLKAQDIAAIGISAVMAAITPVDENCNPLRNAILYGIDTRCTKQADELNEKIGDATLKSKFGGPLTVEHFGPKILWIRENEPEIFAKTKHFTMASGFLTARLTGNYYVDRYSAGSATPMVDPGTMEWDDDFCNLVCPKESLPKITGSYTVVGKVTKKAMDETGIAEGTTVICGTTDAGAEAVSVGVVESGDMMLMYGSTAFFINLAKDKHASRLWACHYTIDGLYSYIGGMATTGSLTKWIRNVMAKDLLRDEDEKGLDSYHRLFSEAADIPVGSDGLIVLPYFQGERMPIQDTRAKGMFFGMNLRHTRGHIVHAAFEGIGFGIAQNIDLMRNKGLSLKNVVAVGGGTKTPQLVNIVSDICGISQKVPEITIGASYGDALMAGLAIGAVSSPSQIKELVKIKYVSEPNMKNNEIYKEYREIYMQLYERNKDLMHLL